MTQTGRAYDVDTMTIHLQGYGRHPAIFAENIHVGGAVVYNHGHRALVLDVAEKSAKFVTVTTRETDGKTYTRAYRKDRLVAWIDAPGSEAATATIAAAVKADEDAENVHAAAVASGDAAAADRTYRAWRGARFELIAVRQNLPHEPFATITTDPVTGELTPDSTVTITPGGATAPVPETAEIGGTSVPFRITAALGTLGYHRVGWAHEHAPGVLTSEVTRTTA